MRGCQIICFLFVILISGETGRAADGAETHTIIGKNEIFTFIRSTKIRVFPLGSVKSGKVTPRSSVVGSRRPTVVVVGVVVVGVVVTPES